MTQLTNTQQIHQRPQINGPIPRTGIQKLLVTAHCPFHWMRDNTRMHPIQIDINHTTHYIPIRVHGRRMVAIFPIGTTALFTLIVFLSGTLGDQLRATGNFAFASVEYQKVYVIRGYDVAQDTKSGSLTRLKQPVSPSPPISGKLEQEFPLVAAVGNVPGVAWKMESTHSRHPFLLKESHFWAKMVVLSRILASI